ncbi:UbiA family prenyltransferase [Pedobacter sp. PLR]|uniref:UbiA family prenyltransferase n=1 Tax=Pedobacter sp. PLR TaxID=2994465 RepID=UPI00224729F8|nr:UbiA family prenyltransferase [Pedobacter sp. PLR]MCX2449854.1 UbiA family prenyltransferase [Pedobacter sp. PLR]
MSVFKVIRSQEWWSYKLPPLLAIGYATALMSAVPLYKVALHLLFLLASLIVGAIYVSVVNDITDLEEDLASGKSNRIQKVPVKLRWLIPVLCLLSGLMFGYFLYPDLLSCLLYLLSWIVFSLYSIKPIRLKNRGIWGVLADATGSHLFTSLLMVASVSYVTHQELNIVWFIAVAGWSFCYGLRGILWHQFSDRENDLKVNLNTYASHILPADFEIRARLIMGIECVCLLLMLYELQSAYALIFLVFYFILLFGRRLLYHTQLILILFKKERPFQILMADYYQVFFPVSLLLAAILLDPKNIIIFGIHAALFSDGLKNALKDYLKFSRFLLTKK